MALWYAVLAMGSSAPQVQRVSTDERLLSGFKLPRSQLRRARRRLGILCLWLGVAFAIDVVGAAVLAAATSTTPSLSWIVFSVQVVATAAVLGVWWATRVTRLNHRFVLTLGLGLEVLLALAFALIAHSFIYAWRGHFTPVTWVPAIILLFPLIVPVPARLAWLVGGIAALMDPLGLHLVSWRLGEPVSIEMVGFALGGSLFAAVGAGFAAKLVHGLAREAARGHHLGSYHLVEKIAEGGMGEVWRAEHEMLHRAAAIKFVRERVLASGDADRIDRAVARFEREARITAELQSPHVVQLYDYGRATDGRLYYVMEYLEGCDLRRLVEDDGPLAPGRAVSLVRQACDALEDAHAHDLVHRDIKPANLFLCRRGLGHDFLKVLDFGLVGMDPAGLRAEVALTQEATVNGTPAYMPPEAATSAESVDRHADIYSLGCVLYWLLTGRQVFTEASAVAVIAAHIHTLPVAPSTYREGLSSALDQVVLDCLRKDPMQRPDSARDLASRLAATPEADMWTVEQAGAWWASRSLPR